MGKIKSTEVYAKWNGEKQDGCITVNQDGVAVRKFGLGLDRHDTLVREELKKYLTQPLVKEEKNKFAKDIIAVAKMRDNA